MQRGSSYKRETADDWHSVVGPPDGPQPRLQLTRSQRDPKSGTFLNPWPTFAARSLSDVLKWKMDCTRYVPKFPTPQEASRLLPSAPVIDWSTIRRFEVKREHGKGTIEHEERRKSTSSGGGSVSQQAEIEEKLDLEEVVLEHSLAPSAPQALLETEVREGRVNDHRRQEMPQQRTSDHCTTGVAVGDGHGGCNDDKRSAKTEEEKASDDSKDERDILSVTWCGHASYLVQHAGVSILTDPVWSERASPIQFMGPKRMVPPPMRLSTLPRIDIATISHNHYDHLDTQTVTELIKHNHHHPLFIVPLEMKSRWFAHLPASSGIILSRVIELDWWERVTLTANDVFFSHDGRGDDLSPSAGALPSSLMLPSTRGGATLGGSTMAATEGESTGGTRGAKNEEDAPKDQSGGWKVRVTAVPVQHWSMRTGLDKFKELWCGFVMDVATGSDSYHRSEWTEHDDCRKEGQPEKLMREETTAALSDERHPNSSSDRLLFKRVLHAGDTGMCSVFKEIGQALGPMDVALIPIGAYSPRSFMAPQHIDPAEAVQVHLDVRSRNSFGMHWGTFILTDEPIDEPPRLLREALVKRGLAEGEFRTLKHGETARI